MRTFKLKPLSLAVITFLAAGQLYAQESTDAGKVTVTGEGDKLGTGLLVDEDTPKGKSTVTRSQLEKSRPTANAFQSLNLLPGVNAMSIDGTGMWGGSLRVRGFNSDQMGFTIDGAPVNDSGSFAVYPQEFTDNENTCELFVTQGGTDNEAPHVGASGGNIGMSSCGAEDKRRFRVSQSLGQLDYRRTFMRYDTGKIGDFKGFISYSTTAADKWKGEGEAQREHIDAKAEYDLGKGSKLSSGFMYNWMMNHNYMSQTPAVWNTTGYKYDYGYTQFASGTTPSSSYYDTARNPFENFLITPKANLQLTSTTRLDIEPYYWWGYGGSTGLYSLKEGTSSTSTSASASTLVHGGIGDLNGDGDRLDTVYGVRSSVTETNRPGITTKVTHTLDNHQIMYGVWAERARHRQTQPYTKLDASGTFDPWIEANLYNMADGTPAQGRDWKTITNAHSVFAQDTIDLMNSRLQITPSLSWREVRRDFQNYPNLGYSGSYSGNYYYRIQESYRQFLPGLSGSFKFTDRTQGFASVTRNFKTPGNFDYGNLAINATKTAPLSVKQETTTNYEMGTRFSGDWYKASATVFYMDYKNRIASSWDPVEGITHDWNVGDSTVKGVELEGGTSPWNGLSFYGSLSYTKSTINDNMLASATSYYATAGKQFPDTPKHMASASVQYVTGPVLLNLTAKYTGKRYLTMVNDAEVKGYTLLDFNAAWKIANNVEGYFKNPILRFNVSNLTNQKYWVTSLGSGSSVQISSTTGSTYVYAGAPRFASVTFQVDY